MNPEFSAAEVEALLQKHTPATRLLTPKTTLSTSEPPPVSDDAPPSAVWVDEPEASASEDLASEEGALPLPATAPEAPGKYLQEAGDAPEENVNSPLQLRFSPPPDAPFQSSLTLDLVCASAAAQIRYALGAATVDEHGLLFDAKEKIFLSQPTLVAARAFENGVAGPLLSAKFEVQKPQWQAVEPTDQSDATPHQSGEVCPCADGWHLAAGSVRGKLHAHRGLWREDSFALADIETSDGVWSVVAVSDGAGSAPLSRVGSRLACAAVMESLRATLGEISVLADDQPTLVANDLPRLRECLVKSGVAALEAIRGEAQTRARPLSAFAATLLVLVRREWNGAHLCAGLQVGDGSIALWDGGGLTLLGEADHGQHSSETRFLTTGGVDAELASRIKFSIKNDLRALAVMSDGVSDDYFPEEKRLSEVFAAVLPLVRAHDDGAAVVAWLGYEKKGSSDDRTLVVGWPAAAPPMPLQTEASDGAIQAADSHVG